MPAIRALRGRGISNCSRIYIVVAEDPTGARREIHVAFDQWPPRKGQLEVLLERENRPTTKPPPPQS